MCRALAILAIGAAPLSVTADDVTQGRGSRPRFTVSKATTYVTGPLTKDGGVDYAAALNQRFGKGVTPMNNANVLYWRAIGPVADGEKVPSRFFKLLGMKPLPAKGAWFVDFDTYLEQAGGIKHESKQWKRAEDHFWEAMKSPWKADAFPHVAAWLKANEKPLKLVVTGTQREKFFSPLVVPRPKRDGELPGLIDAMARGTTQFRDFSRALTARAMRHLNAGRTDAAMRDLLAGHRLARHVGTAPFLVNALVGIAIENRATYGDLELLRHGKLSRKDVAQMLAELQRLPLLPVIADKINPGERFLFLDTTMKVARDTRRRVRYDLFKTAFMLTESRLGKKRFEKTLQAVNWDVVLKRGNQWYDRLVTALHEPDPIKRRRALETVEKEFESGLATLRKLAKQPKPDNVAVSNAIANILLATFFPAAMQCRTAEDRARQRFRNVRIACALAAYRIDHGGYPAKLEALQPKYLEKAPADVFSGRPLKYRSRGKGYLLYSVGPNGRDNSGWNREHKLDADDITVRMPGKRN